jgi:hypothetical protein
MTPTAALLFRDQEGQPHILPIPVDAFDSMEGFRLQPIHTVDGVYLYEILDIQVTVAKLTMWSGVN